MGQLCAPSTYDADRDPQLYALAYRAAGSSSLPSNQRGPEKILSTGSIGLPMHAQPLTSDEALRRIDQLERDLRMSKDDNYRIREDQLKLEKELKDASRRTGTQQASSAAPSPQVDPEQQLMYMQEMIRKLQAENTRLRSSQQRDGSTAAVSVPGVPGENRVSEEEFKRLQQRLQQLQQAHLGQLRQARQLQASSALSSKAPSTVASGRATPVGTSSGASPAQGGVNATDLALRGQYEALLQEQEKLRSKVRKVARSLG